MIFVGDAVGFSVPIEDRFFEDYVPGAKYEFGAVKVSEQQIIRFAEEFDPQSFHVDPRPPRPARSTA